MLPVFILPYFKKIMKWEFTVSAFIITHIGLQKTAGRFLSFPTCINN